MTIQAWVWGTGAMAEAVVGAGLVQPLGFVDSAQSRWGQHFYENTVVGPSALLGDSAPVVIASVYFEEIYDQALLLGVEPERLHAAFRDEVLSPEQTSDMVEKQRKQNRWIQQFRDAHLADAVGYGDEHLEHIRAAAKLAKPHGLALEFGVFKASSLNVLAATLEQRVYGFDAFSGLRQAWTVFHRKGAFDLKGDLPRTHPNAELVVGYFEDTLPQFLDTHPEPVSFMHCDADLFESTEFVLRLCKSRFFPGTVLVMDDFLHPMDYERCDFRAFETLRSDIDVEYLSWDRSGSVAMKVLKVKGQ